ncbi:hypothetical protein PG989_001120 [Apiospora arundinis]
MEQQSKKVIAQRARAIGQELQKEMRIVTQRQIDTMVAFQARLEAQTRAVEPAMGVINRLVTIKDSGLDDLHPEIIAVTSQRSPRGTKAPGDKPIDVASVVRSQTTEHYAQGIATEKQRCTGESPGPMGKEKIGELADENITQKRLRRSRQAGPQFENQTLKEFLLERIEPAINEKIQNVLVVFRETTQEWDATVASAFRMRCSAVTWEVRSEGSTVMTRTTVVETLHVPAELANSEEPEPEDTVMEDAPDTAPNLGTQNSPKLCGDGSKDQETTDADQISCHTNSYSLTTDFHHEDNNIDPMDMVV